MFNSQDIAESVYSGESLSQGLNSRPIANSKICKKLVSLTDDAYCTVRLYQGIFSHEPAIVAGVLRIANSQALKNPILTLSEAISFLGWKKIRGIVSAICLANISNKENPVLELVWKQCCLRTFICSVLAASKSTETKAKVEQICYFLSLGKFQMAAREPERYAEVLNLVKSGCNLNEAEQAKFGFIGYNLSVELCQAWKLPEFFSKSISDYALGRSKCEAQEVLALGELLSIAVIYENSQEFEQKLNIANLDKILTRTKKELECTKKLSGL